MPPLVTFLRIYSIFVITELHRLDAAKLILLYASFELLEDKQVAERIALDNNGINFALSPSFLCKVKVKVGLKVDDSLQTAVP